MNFRIVRILQLILIFIITSCTSHEQKVNVNSELYYELIDCYIKMDSSSNISDTPISPDFSAYKYFEPLYFSDGQLAPPPEQRSFVNETRFDNFDLGQNDVNFIIDQIKKSSELVGQINSKIDTLSDQEVPDKFYYFYLPLFNSDSTLVYLQYGLFDNGYEERQAIFLRTHLSKTQCEIIDKYSLWMN